MKDINKVKRRGKKKQSRCFFVHPLFLLLGIYYCFIGELPAFLISALVALQHECAHAFAAAKLGYKLNRIVLMPYGAVIDGDLSGIKFRDEIYVAIWGPLCNFLTAMFFIALWWIWPSLYPYTDTACFISISIAIINLLPAYPLDGGRVLRCALCLTMREDKANKICKIVTIVISIILLFCFVGLWCKGVFNATLFAFSIFVFVGAWGNSERAVYCKINFYNHDAFKRGVEIYRVAITDDCTLKKAMSFMVKDRYLILEIYDKDDKLLGEVRQNKLLEILSVGNLYDLIVDFL